MRKRRATLLVDAGIWLRLAGDEEGARKLFEQALSLDPENRQAAQLAKSSKGADEASATVAPKAAPKASAPTRAEGVRAEGRVGGEPLPSVTREPPVRAPQRPQSTSGPAAERPRQPVASTSVEDRPTEIEALRPLSALAEPEGEHPGFDAALAGLIKEEQSADGATIIMGPLVDAQVAAPSVRETRKAPTRRSPIPSRPPIAESADDEAAQTRERGGSMWPVPSEQRGGGDEAREGSVDRALTVLVETSLPAGVEPSLSLSRRDAIVEYLRETDAYLRYGIYEKAFEFAAKVLAEDPENDEAHQKAKEALLASKGSAAAFEQLLQVLRLYASRLDAERAGPFLDELLAQQPSHPELPVFLSVLRPYELDAPDGGAGEGPALLDQALEAYLEGTLHPELGGDPLDTLPPEATVPSGVKLPSLLRVGGRGSLDATVIGPGHGAQETLPPGARLSADLSAVREAAPAPEMGKTVFEDEDAEAPQPPFRRPRKRR